ncbi:MAG: DUF368 domain-containing protein [Vicingaceae bacterium]
MNKKHNFFLLILKGMAMGAADVVPGVSGGTIAFITGIYEELIETLSNLKLKLFKTLVTEGFKPFWKAINGSFLFTLFTGIIISILSLAKLFKYLLEYYPIPLWSFFFGLIALSVWMVGKKVKKWNIYTILALIAGTAISFYITIASPATGSDGLWYIFICGMVAIIAMILPGISGSFILLLMGAYTVLLTTVSDLIDHVKADELRMVVGELRILFVFFAGCVIGLLGFSRVLNWLFKKSHDIVIAVLSGFLLGSLNKIWPWKETIAYRLNSKGEEVPFLQNNVLPNVIENNYLIQAILLALLGALIILVLNKYSPENNTKKG